MRSADTSAEAHRVQVDIWRRMGGPATAALSLRMSDEARQVAMDGVRARHPEYTDEQVRHAVFRLTLGDRLYQAARPDRLLLDP